MPRTGDLLSLHVADALGGKLAIDEEAGVIDGVTVITLGEAINHGFMVDNVLLTQIVEGINSQANGVKVRITHPEKSEADGALYLVGRVSDARIDGDRVRAKFTVADYAALSPQGDLRSYIISIAKEDPSVIGMSVVFNRAEFEVKPGPGGVSVPYGRAAGVYAVDLTDFPSANSNGLLSGASNMNLAAKLEQLLGVRAENEQARTDLIFALASAAGIETFVLTDMLNGVAMCPTLEQLGSFANTLGVDIAELRVAAEADGCGYAQEASEESAETTTAEGGDPPADETTAMTGNRPPSMDRMNTVYLNGQKAERERYTALNGIGQQAALGDEWVTEQYLAGTTVENARKLAMTHLANKNKPPVVSGGRDNNIESLGDGIRDALMLRANPSRRQLHEHDADGFVMLSGNGGPKLRDPHERSRQFRGMTLIEVSREYLRAIGVNTDGMARTDVAKLVFNKGKVAGLTGNMEFLAHSTADFPAILEDTMGRTLRQAYIESPTTWSLVFRESSAPDFKQISRTQLSGVGVPPQVRAGQEYGYAHLADGKEVYALAKYGHVIVIDWETLINDDMDAFSRIPTVHGNAAARLEDDLAWAQITANPNMADGNPLFDALHGNLGTAADITVASLGEHRKLMRLQRGLKSGDAEDTERLNLATKYLVVPANLETTADQIISSQVDPTKSNATPNPFHNKLEVVAEPRLDEDSTTNWYTAASHAQIDTVEVCFLEGERQPFLEEQDGFMVDGRKYKLRHVCAAKVIDFRGLSKNPWAG